jgi:hypothetical protein
VHEPSAFHQGANEDQPRLINEGLTSHTLPYVNNNKNEKPHVHRLYVQPIGGTKNKSKSKRSKRNQDNSSDGPLSQAIRLHPANSGIVSWRAITMRRPSLAILPSNSQGYYRLNRNVVARHRMGGLSGHLPSFHPREWSLSHDHNKKQTVKSSGYNIMFQSNLTSVSSVLGM